MESYYVELTDIGRSRLSKEEIDTSLKDDEALIKTEYSLISAGTELSRAFALKKGFKYPVRPGYCGVGRIIDKGNDLELNIGDRVFFNAPHASLVKWKTSDSVQGPLIVKLSEDIDSADVTFMNLLLVALQGVNLTETKLGYNVAVFGLGNIGILTALMYQKAGCRVIGIDPVKQRCELASSMGLKYTAYENAKDAIDGFTNKKGVDIAVDVTGLSPVITDCIAAAGKYGQVLLLGSPRQSHEMDVTPLLSQIHMKDLRIIGAFNETISVKEKPGSVDSMERNFRVAEDLLRNKDIEVSKLISRIIDPKDCESAYYDLMYKKDKVNGIVYDWRNY